MLGAARNVDFKSAVGDLEVGRLPFHQSNLRHYDSFRVMRCRAAVPPVLTAWLSRVSFFVNTRPHTDEANGASGKVSWSTTAPKGASHGHYVQGRQHHCRRNVYPGSSRRPTIREDPRRRWSLPILRS